MSQNSSGRLTTPLIREGQGHRSASWEEALDCIVSRLQEQIRKHGSRAVGMFSCSKATNELNYVAQKFVRAVVGGNNIDSCNRT